MPSKKPVISLRLDPDVLILVQQKAEQMGVSQSAYVQGVLREALGIHRRFVDPVHEKPVAGPGAASMLPRKSLYPCGSGRKIKNCREKGLCK
jgi:hypothetical protein